MLSLFDATAVFWNTEVLLRRKTMHGNYGVFNVIMQYCSSILFAAGQGLNEYVCMCVCISVRDSMDARA